MRNLKLKATLKTILSDWPDRPNQGECQFPVVHLVLSLNTVCFGFFFNWKRAYLTERKRGAKNLQNLLAFSKSSPSFLFVTSFSLRKAVCKLVTAVAWCMSNPQSRALPCQQLEVLPLYFCSFSSWITVSPLRAAQMIWCGLSTTAPTRFSLGLVLVSCLSIH